MSKPTPKRYRNVLFSNTDMRGLIKAASSSWDVNQIYPGLIESSRFQMLFKRLKTPKRTTTHPPRFFPNQNQNRKNRETGCPNPNQGVLERNWLAFYAPVVLFQLRSLKSHRSAPAPPHPSTPRPFKWTRTKKWLCGLRGTFVQW